MLWQLAPPPHSMTSHRLYKELQRQHSVERSSCYWSIERESELSIEKTFEKAFPAEMSQEEEVVGIPLEFAYLNNFVANMWLQTIENTNVVYYREEDEDDFLTHTVINGSDNISVTQEEEVEAIQWVPSDFNTGDEFLNEELEDQMWLQQTVENTIVYFEPTYYEEYCYYPSLETILTQEEEVEAVQWVPLEYNTYDYADQMWLQQTVENTIVYFEPTYYEEYSFYPSLENILTQEEENEAVEWVPLHFNTNDDSSDECLNEDQEDQMWLQTVKNTIINFKPKYFENCRFYPSLETILERDEGHKNTSLVTNIVINSPDNPGHLDGNTTIMPELKKIKNVDDKNNGSKEPTDLEKRIMMYGTDNISGPKSFDDLRYHPELDTILPQIFKGYRFYVRLQTKLEVDKEEEVKTTGCDKHPMIDGWDHISMPKSFEDFRFRPDLDTILPRIFEGFRFYPRLQTKLEVDKEEEVKTTGFDKHPMIDGWDNISIQRDEEEKGHENTILVTDTVIDRLADNTEHLDSKKTIMAKSKKVNNRRGGRVSGRWGRFTRAFRELFSCCSPRRLDDHG